MVWSAPGFREITIDSTAGGHDRAGLVGAVDRMPDFPGLTGDARAILAGTRLLVVGTGSVGGRIAEHAARCRVGEIGLVDPKTFSANFDTQVTRSRSDIGRPKAAQVGAWAKTISPSSIVRVFDGSVQALSWLDLDDYDIVVASTDNLLAEVYLGETCMALGLPLLYASVHGPTLCSQVRVFMNRNGDSPCPSCGYSRAEREQLSSGTRFSCDPSAGGEADLDGPPTVSVSPLCSLAADMAMLEVLRMRLRLGSAPCDCVRELNGYTGASVTTPLSRRAACGVDHTVLERVYLDRPLGECTLRDCAEAAGVTGDEGIARTSFAVDDSLFAPVLTCTACGASHEHNGFVDRRRGTLPRPCRACGHHGLAPHPFRSFDRLIPARAGGLLPHLDVPLRALGADGRGVVVRYGRKAVLLRWKSDRTRDTTS